MTITIRDVARRAGVSAMTVSRVTNGSQHVNAETRQRVEQAIAELGYVPNNVARGLSRQKSDVVALIVPDVTNPFFTLIVNGAEDVARRAGYRVILCNTKGDLNREKEYLQDMIAHRVEGILIAPVSDQSRRYLSMLTQHNIPFVLVDRSIAELDCDQVQGDSAGGAYRLVEHLISLGHRRIALIIESTDVSTARDRLQGYHRALEDARIPLDPALIIQAQADAGGGYRATQQLLQLANRPAAIFAVNNMVAVGVIRALREHNLEAPRDMGLVCFDDIEHAAEICPFLTVMAQPAETFGAIATQLLLERIAGRAPERRRMVVLPADMIVRQSCGAQHDDKMTG